MYSSKSLNVSRFRTELNFKVSAVVIDSFKMIVLSIYYSLAGNTNIFLEIYVTLKFYKLQLYGIIWHS